MTDQLAITSQSFSVALIALMRGVVERNGNSVAWTALLQHTESVRDHVAVLGLDLALDETEGFAYLAQRAPVEGAPELPRLIPRRQLSYPVSLLLALLRKKLVEHDAMSSDSRLILSREAIAEMVALFLPDAANQVRQQDRIDANIKRVVELGFLRPLRGQDGQYEVQRILRAFVDAQWLDRFVERLAEYQAHGATGDGAGTQELELSHDA